MPEPKFKLGDEVVVVEPSYLGRAAAEVTTTKVVRVGTKFVYVEGNWRIAGAQFNKFTGHEKSPYNDARRIWVPAEYESREHRAKVLAELKEFEIRIGREYSSNGDERYPTETLEKLLAVVKEAQ